MTPSDQIYPDAMTSDTMTLRPQDVQWRLTQTFSLPIPTAPPPKPPSPVFARFNPCLVAPKPIQTPTQPQTVIINNYYGTNSRRPQCMDPMKMSRSQFAR